jgi:processing peptidase subunit alpha
VIKPGVFRASKFTQHPYSLFVFGCWNHVQAVHSVAYHGGLGHPLIAPEGVLPSLNADVLAEFYASNYTAPRMVLAAAGVDHAQLLSVAEPLLSAAPKVPAPKEPASQYVGGDWRQFAPSPLTHAVLAFQFEGGWRDVKGSVAATVLQYLLGGGSTFSSGGPGKGMHSRLYSRVLNQYPWMHNCMAVTSIYNTTGLVGIFTSAEAPHAEEAVAVMCRELQAVAADVPAVELERAKAAATSSVLMNLESRAVVAEDIGRQVLTYGHRKPVGEFLAQIQSLTAADLTSAVTKMLKTAPTLAVMGDIASVPRYDIIASRFSK